MTATLDTAPDTTDVVAAPTTRTPDTVVAEPSTRESRAAARAVQSEAERGQYVHGFVWALIGLIISMGLFGLVALRDGADNHHTTTSVSSTVAP